MRTASDSASSAAGELASGERARRSISSAPTTSPWPIPGQSAASRSQAAGVATMRAQNGQVRHCRGRTS